MPDTKVMGGFREHNMTTTINMSPSLRHSFMFWEDLRWKNGITKIGNYDLTTGILNENVFVELEWDCREERRFQVRGCQRPIPLLAVSGTITRGANCEEHRRLMRQK